LPHAARDLPGRWTAGSNCNTTRTRRHGERHCVLGHLRGSCISDRDEDLSSRLIITHCRAVGGRLPSWTTGRLLRRPPHHHGIREGPQHHAGRNSLSQRPSRGVAGCTEALTAFCKHPVACVTCLPKCRDDVDEVEQGNENKTSLERKKKTRPAGGKKNRLRRHIHPSMYGNKKW